MSAIIHEDMEGNMDKPVIYVRRELTITTHADGPIPAAVRRCADDLPYVFAGDETDTPEMLTATPMRDYTLVVETTITRVTVAALAENELPSGCRRLIADLEVQGDAPENPTIRDAHRAPGHSPVSSYSHRPVSS